MKIIISERFEKKYFKWFEKYFSLEDFCNHLKSKNHTLILLHTPFQKFKWHIGNTHIRAVVVLIQWNVIPLTLFLKKDKNYGENVSWQTQRIIIIEEYNIVTQDISDWKYKVY